MRWRRSARCRWSRSRACSRTGCRISSTACPACRFRSAATIPRPSINIRGLQDFGRVAVVVDGARQNYQRTGHNANGSFFLDPELVGGVDVVRGPTANIYGSGAIGGVVVVPHQGHQRRRAPGRALGRRHDRIRAAPTMVAASARSSAACASIPNVDVFGGAVYRTQGNYKDGNGTEIGNTGNRARRRPDEAHGASRRRPRDQARRRIPG